jgi:hypothetical protein
MEAGKMIQGMDMTSRLAGRNAWFWKLEEHVQDQILARLMRAMMWRGWDSHGGSGIYQHPNGSCQAAKLVDEMAEMIEAAGVGVLQVPALPGCR